VHLRYPYYFREQMFTAGWWQNGYVVLDLDYRASAGYGRDCDGHLSTDGSSRAGRFARPKKWLAEQASAIRNESEFMGLVRALMTLMALFRAPGDSPPGCAASVTDWMQYEHGYTSDILNDPQIDPIALCASSPLNLPMDCAIRCSLSRRHRRQCVVRRFDAFVSAVDRIAQKDFAISPNPLDRHAFSNADSWLDEYKRSTACSRRI